MSSGDAGAGPAGADPEARRLALKRPQRAHANTKTRSLYGFGHRPRLHELVACLWLAARRRDRRQGAAQGARSRLHAFRHGRHVRLRRQRDASRPNAERPPQGLRAREQMRHDPERARRARDQRPPRALEANLRREPAPPADGRDRSLLLAPLGQARADRGQRRRARRARPRRQGENHRPFGGLGRHAQQSPSRSPHHRRSIGILAMDAQSGDQGLGRVQDARYHLRRLQPRRARLLDRQAPRSVDASKTRTCGATCRAFRSRISAPT